MANSPPSSTVSSTATMSSVPILSTPSSNNTKSSPPTCATSWSQTTSPTSSSGRDWIISTPCASGSKPSQIASPASRRNGSTSMSTSRCCNVSPSPSPSAQSAIPASSSMIRASSACSKSSCTVAATSVAGPPSKSIKPLSPPSIFPTDATASTNCATTYENSKAMACCSGTYPATPTASPKKASRSRYSFCSSTNGSAVRSPTAASTTAPSPVTSHTANWKPHITAPTKPSNRSSICLPPDLRSDNAFVKLVLSNALSLRRSGGK